MAAQLTNVIHKLRSGVDAKTYDHWKIKVTQYLHIHGYDITMKEGGESTSNSKEKGESLSCTSEGDQQQRLIISSYLMVCCEGNEVAEETLLNGGVIPSPSEIIRKLDGLYSKQKHVEIQDIVEKYENFFLQPGENGTALGERLTKICETMERCKVCPNETLILFKYRRELKRIAVYAPIVANSFSSETSFETLKSQIRGLDEPVRATPR